MGNVIPASTQLYGYAFDQALKDTFSANERITETESITVARDLMKDSNRIKMNNSKTEVLYWKSNTT